MKRHTGYGWLELIEGILLIILGALAIASPGGILRWITIFYGVMAIVTGITDIIFYAKSERYIGFAPCVSLAAGVISVITGLALMAYPHIGELVVTLLLPLWFIAHSVSKLCHLRFIRSLYRGRYFYVSLVINVIGLVVGVLMIFWPQIALFSVGFLIGTYLIILGIDSVISAAAGVLFGTAGIKLLTSRDAKKVYSHGTAAVLRAKDCVMKTVTNVQENASDIYAEAKQINADREIEAEAQVVEDEAEEQAEENEICD